MRKEVIKSIKVYLCDPKVNTSCKKTSCFEKNGPCYLSQKKRMRSRDQMVLGIFTTGGLLRMKRYEDK